MTNKMNSRERILRTLAHKPVDRPAVQFYYSPVGYYEHGEKLNDLYARYPGDFERYARQPIPVIPKSDFDENGLYHAFATDDWGVKYEYRVFGIMGHTYDFPIKTPEDMAGYAFPPLPHYAQNDAGLRTLAAHFASAKNERIAMAGSGASFLERVSAIRGFDELMMDLYDDSAEVNAFLDRLTDYYLQNILALIRAGAECIDFGDDYGTQSSLILSRDLFRHAIKPRLNRLMAPIRQAGIHIHFHSCGRILELFGDLKELGVGSIWPQMPVYGMAELRDACKEYNFAIALHPDRAVTMTHGSPADVRELIGNINETFKPKDGGAWFYVEADTGFPFENIEALVETVGKL